MNKPIYIIKLGGSSITDKAIPYKARRDVIRKLAREIKKAGDNHGLVVSHGSGSFGHTSATKFGGARGYESKIGIATVSSDAARINQIVTDIFVEEGLPVVSLSPMSMMLSKNGELSSNFFQVIEEVLDQGLIPLVYGDVVWDKSWKSTIFSGEKTLGLIAEYLKSKKYNVLKMVEVGETAGLLDEKGKTIPEVTKNNWITMKDKIFLNGRADVTGGMRHKIEEALDLTDFGIETILINNNKNQLFASLSGGSASGTLIKKA